MRTEQLRLLAAARLGAATARLSRLSGAGAGTTIGGRVTLALEPRALHRAAVGRRLVLISGTNGKSTTRSMLTAALSGQGPVLSNRGGANMPAGLTAALLADRAARIGVLEVDEPYLPAVIEATRPEVVVLLNLSRDQLDRSAEVQRLATLWRGALHTAPGIRIIANADDPLVTWAAGSAADVTWVSAGLRWSADATVCPACGRPLRFLRDGWASDCGFRRRTPSWEMTDGGVIDSTGRPYPFSLHLPGEANRANAVMAAAAAEGFGVSPAKALGGMSGIREVEGRYAELPYAGRLVRLMLAKNPAGWQAALSMIRPDPAQLVIAVNARAADGRDPAWLWDVPFEQLRGRFVVAAGDRAADMAVRLRYADVEHTTVRGGRAALEVPGGSTVEVVANYTAFHAFRRILEHD